MNITRRNLASILRPGVVTAQQLVTALVGRRVQTEIEVFDSPRHDDYRPRRYERRVNSLMHTLARHDPRIEEKGGGVYHVHSQGARMGDSGRETRHDVS